MNKLNKFFIITMMIGLLLVGLAIQTKNPLIVSLTGFIVCFLSAIGYALNEGK